MSFPIKPINPGPVGGVQVHPDRAHGPWPDHADVRITGLEPGLSQKLRVDHSGNILSDDLEFGNRFLKDL